MMLKAANEQCIKLRLFAISTVAISVEQIKTIRQSYV